MKKNVKTIPYRYFQRRNIFVKTLAILKVLCKPVEGLEGRVESVDILKEGTTGRG